MNEIMPYYPKLPRRVRRELDRQRDNMEKIAYLAIKALDEQSQIFSYSVFKVVTTMNTIEVLKKASKVNGMTPQIEASIQQLSNQYLKMMELIPSYACSKIVQGLQDVPHQPGGGHFLQNVVDSFSRRLPG